MRKISFLTALILFIILGILESSGGINMTKIPEDNFGYETPILGTPVTQKQVCSEKTSSLDISSLSRLFASQDTKEKQTEPILSWKDLYKENTLSEPQGDIKLDGVNWSYYETKYFKIYFVSDKNDYENLKESFDKFYANSSILSDNTKDFLPDYDEYLRRIRFLASRLDNCYKFQIQLFGKSAIKSAESKSGKLNVYYPPDEESVAALSLIGHMNENLDYLKNYAKRHEEESDWKELDLLPILNEYNKNKDLSNKKFELKAFNVETFKEIYRKIYPKGGNRKLRKIISCKDGIDILSKIFSINKEHLSKIYDGLSKWVSETQTEWPRQFKIDVAEQPHCLGHGWIMTPLRYGEEKDKDTLRTNMHELGHLIQNGPDQIKFDQQQICIFLERMADFYRPDNKDKVYNFYKDEMFFNEDGTLKFSIEEMKDMITIGSVNEKSDEGRKILEKFKTTYGEDRFEAIRDASGSNDMLYPQFILSYLYYNYHMPVFRDIIQKFYKYDNANPQDQSAMGNALIEKLGINLSDLENNITNDISKNKSK